MRKKMRKRILCMLAVLLFVMQVMPVAAAELPVICDNYNYTFDGLNGGQISSQSSGKAKVLVFYRSTCKNCVYVLSNIAKSGWLKSGELADVCAIEIMGAGPDEVNKFYADNCQDAGSMIQFDDGSSINNAMYSYAKAGGVITEKEDGSWSVATPVVAIIDAENKLRDVQAGRSAADGIEEKLNALKAGAGNTPGEDDSQKPDEPQNPDDTGNPDDSQNPDDTGKPGDSQNPDDTQKPGDTETPDDVQKPDGKPGGADADKGESGSGSKSSGSSAPVCSHVTESVLISGATAGSDAVAAYRCVKCGAVLSYETVANSAYASFLDETANSILNAKESEVMIDAKVWVSFNRKVFEAMKSRPDVAVTVNYVFEGEQYTLKIPAGTDVSLLMDENGFGGFRYIEKVLNTKK